MRGPAFRRDPVAPPRRHGEQQSTDDDRFTASIEYHRTNRRWIKGDAPSFEDVLKTMQERVAKFNVEKIKPQDLAGAAGPPDGEP